MYTFHLELTGCCDEGDVTESRTFFSSKTSTAVKYDLNNTFSYQTLGNEEVGYTYLKNYDTVQTTDSTELTYQTYGTEKTTWYKSGGMSSYRSAYTSNEYRVFKTVAGYIGTDAWLNRVTTLQRRTYEVTQANSYFVDSNSEAQTQYLSATFNKFMATGGGDYSTPRGERKAAWIPPYRNGENRVNAYPWRTREGKSNYSTATNESDYFYTCTTETQESQNHLTTKTYETTARTTQGDKVETTTKVAKTTAWTMGTDHGDITTLSNESVEYVTITHDTYEQPVINDGWNHGFLWNTIISVLKHPAQPQRTYLFPKNTSTISSEAIPVGLTASGSQYPDIYTSFTSSHRIEARTNQRTRKNAIDFTCTDLYWWLRDYGPPTWDHHNTPHRSDYSPVSVKALYYGTKVAGSSSYSDEMCIAYFDDTTEQTNETGRSYYETHTMEESSASLDYTLVTSDHAQFLIRPQQHFVRNTDDKYLAPWATEVISYTTDTEEGYPLNTKEGTARTIQCLSGSDGSARVPAGNTYTRNFGDRQLTTTTFQYDYLTQEWTTTQLPLYNSDTWTRWSRSYHTMSIVGMNSFTHRSVIHDPSAWQELEYDVGTQSLYTGMLGEVTTLERGSATDITSSTWLEGFHRSTYRTYSAGDNNGGTINLFSSSALSAKAGYVSKEDIVKYNEGGLLDLSARLRFASPWLLYDLSGSMGYMDEQTGDNSTNSDFHGMISWQGMSTQDYGFHQSESPVLDWVHWRITQGDGETFQDTHTRTDTITETVYPPQSLNSYVFDPYEANGCIPMSIATNHDDLELIFPSFECEVQVTFTDECLQTWTWDSLVGRYGNDMGYDGDSDNSMCASPYGTFDYFSTDEAFSEEREIEIQRTEDVFWWDTGIRHPWWYGNAFHGTADPFYTYITDAIPVENIATDNGSPVLPHIVGSRDYTGGSPISPVSSRTFYMGAMGYALLSETHSSTGWFNGTYVLRDLATNEDFMSQWHGKTKAKIYYDTEGSIWVLEKKWKEVKGLGTNSRSEHRKVTFGDAHSASEELTFERFGTSSTWNNFGMRPMLAGASNYGVVEHQRDIGYFSSEYLYGADNVHGDRLFAMPPAWSEGIVNGADGIYSANNGYAYTSTNCCCETRYVYIHGNHDQIMGTEQPSNGYQTMLTNPQIMELDIPHNNASHINTHQINRFGSNGKFSLMYKQSFLEIPNMSVSIITRQDTTTSAETSQDIIGVGGTAVSVATEGRQYMVAKFPAYAQYIDHHGVYGTHYQWKGSEKVTLQWCLENMMELVDGNIHKVGLENLDAKGRVYAGTF